MLTSAPFDNWWHSAYGLDVKIISPPHTLLLLGDRAVAIGILFLVLAAMNSAKVQSHAADERSVGKIRTLFLYLGGLIVVGQMFFILENTWDVRLHSASAYIAICLAIPVVLAALSRASVSVSLFGEPRGCVRHTLWRSKGGGNKSGDQEGC